MKEFCSMCDRPVRARGLCITHYNQWRTEKLHPNRNRYNGRTSHPLYFTWHSMLDRCYDATAHNYRWYGGRGISVHSEWHGPEGFWTFVAYLEQTLGPRPTGMSLDRVDPNGNYEPGNIRWADRATQSANRRDAISIAVGQRFGRLVVTGLFREKQRMASCNCDCGGTLNTRVQTLAAGKATSCGCVRKEKLRLTRRRYT
jgi:hypothetical protein